MIAVTHDDGAVLGFDSENWAESPISFDTTEVEPWEANWKVLGAQFRTANGLLSSYAELHPRLRFLGRSPVSSKAMVLALLDSHVRARTLLTALPSLLPDRYPLIDVWCPTFEPEPMLAKLLEGSGIRFHLLDPGRPFEMAATDAVAQYAFQRHGPIWAVTFDGHASTLGHSKGMEYIARLLARPGDQIGASELSAAAPVRSTRATVVDRETQDSVQARAREIDEELQDAQLLGDNQRQVRLREELEAILDQRVRDTKIGGRSREFTDDSDRVRSSVRRAIDRALKAISKQDFPAGDFLRAQIDTGHSCRYRTAPEIFWIL